MSVSLSLEFLWGRYHATPWNSNVNDGRPEWPPSVWRVLRAFVSAKHNHFPNEDSDIFESLISKLAKSLPSFLLPLKVDSHTRHYMPDEKHMSLTNSKNRDLIFDSFVICAQNESSACPLYIVWDQLELTDEERDLLAQIAEKISYIGRAESVCQVSLVDKKDLPDADGEIYSECLPIQDLPDSEDGAHRRAELVNVLCLSANDGDEKGNVLDLLEATTKSVRAKKRLNLPPGSALVPYSLPVPQSSTYKETAAPLFPTAPNVVSFRIHTNAPPSVYSCVVMSEALRSAAMSKFGRDNKGEPSKNLSGKEENDDGKVEPLKGAHTHAHYLALRDEKSPVLRRFIIWCPDGFSDAEVSALTKIRKLEGKGFLAARDFRECELGLEGLGKVEAIVPELCGPAKKWVSETPFAPAWPANPNDKDPKKRKWRTPRQLTKEDGTMHIQIANSVKRECSYRNLPEPVSVKFFGGVENRLDWNNYRTYRQTGRSRGLKNARLALGLELEFGEEISGPIVLGALSHFGLGLLKPKKD